MPCDTVQTNTVELENVKDLDLLEKALTTAFGLTARSGPRIVFYADGQRVVLDGGRASAAMSEADLQKVVGLVKQAYSREVVALAARKFGWKIKAGADANHFAVQKT